MTNLTEKIKKHYLWEQAWDMLGGLIVGIAMLIIFFTIVTIMSDPYKEEKIERYNNLHKQHILNPEKRSS